MVEVVAEVGVVAEPEVEAAEVEAAEVGPFSLPESRNYGRTWLHPPAAFRNLYSIS